MMRPVVLFCAVLGLATAELSAINQCVTSPGQLPISAQIEGCSSPPCGLPQQEEAVVNIVFKAPREIQSMTTFAIAHLSFGAVSIPIIYNLQEKSETCNFLIDASCPLEANQIVQYQLRVNIESFLMPGVTSNVEFIIADQDNTHVACVRVPVRIDPPRNNAPNAVVGDVEQY